MNPNITDYEKYIRTEDLLLLQKSADERSCHDELTFQVIHQISELHFKLILQSLHLTKEHIEKEEISEASAQLRRVQIHLKHLPHTFDIIKEISPRDYHKIRLALGKGSGQDSPGFNKILKLGPTLWEPFSALLQKHTVTVLELHKNPEEQYVLYELMKNLHEFDEKFQAYRYEHIQLVRRMIGLQTKSLKGIPAQALERGAKFEFFPVIWQAISELTDWTGSSYNPKPLP
ncbi:tryptophan 2,3-dioxygenase family protein [Bacillus sp. 2205SS5-2]|uniref:tryptophan 2,3-dioxygenase family protein n=1 Tax=Bacillus sp. 2205SS5-2 TaxID=3109031 RepID=UPI003004E315